MFATLRVPGFPLAAVLRRRDDAPPPPRAVAVPRGRGSVLAAVDETAGARGISPGMGSARALARCPGLAILPADPAAEEAASGWLLATASGLSPRVEATGGGVATVDLRGTGDPEGLRGRVLPAAEAAGLPVRIGISDTPERSGWAARRADPFLFATTEEGLFAGFPAAEAPLPGPVARALADWGAPDLLAFVRLSKEAVGRRLGPEGTRLWEEMKGRRSRLLVQVEEEPGFRSTMEVEDGIETLEQALFVIRRLLGEVCASLSGAGKAAASLRFEWTCAGGGRGGREFAVPEPTAKPEPLFAVLESHLAGLSTGEPLVSLGLEASPADPLPGQADFFEIAARNPFRFRETVGRVRGLLGDDGFGVPGPTAGHRPDAFRVDPPVVRLGVEEEAAPFGSRVGPALRRFRPPRPVRVVCRDHRPVRCSWNGRSGAVLRARGPFRLSGDWWDPSHRWSREEWDVEWAGQGFCRLARSLEGEWLWEGIYD